MKGPGDTAARLALVLLGLMVVFHGLVLAGIVPYQVVWGGRLTSASQMYAFESVALAITAVIMWIVAMRGGQLPRILPRRMITVLLWVLSAYFLLNTAGNLASGSTVEKIVFTPLALALAGLFVQLARRG